MLKLLIGAVIIGVIMAVLSAPLWASAMFGGIWGMFCMLEDNNGY